MACFYTFKSQYRYKMESTFAAYFYKFYFYLFKLYSAHSVSMPTTDSSPYHTATVQCYALLSKIGPIFQLVLNTFVAASAL